MEIGRRIYFEKTTGVVLVDVGERSGNVIETTEAQDIENFPILQLYAGQYDTIQLVYGELSDSFATCKAYKINPDTKQPEFLF